MRNTFGEIEPGEMLRISKSDRIDPFRAGKAAAAVHF